VNDYPDYTLTATSNDENSLKWRNFMGYFRINVHAFAAQQSMKIKELRYKNCVI